MSKVCALYHIVVSTRHRLPTITNENRRMVYEFIYKLLTEKKCHTYQIGGVPNHIHILMGLPSNAMLADVMRDLKARSSGWMKGRPEFPDFQGWGREYFASTIGYESRGGVIEYIRNQQEHHRYRTLEAELAELCQRCDMPLSTDDLT